MQLVRGLHNLQPQARGCVVTIGNFDGVHRGHQAILARLRERAAELAVPSCVVIFEPQPREFFGPDTAPARLTRLRDKLALLAAEGRRGRTVLRGREKDRANGVEIALFRHALHENRADHSAPTDETNVFHNICFPPG